MPDSRKAHQNPPRMLDRAVEVFVRGFGFTRGLTHPYEANRVGPLWLLRDAPRSSGDYRNEEWVGHGIAPAEVHRIIQKNRQENKRGRFAISFIHPLSQPDDPFRAEFKALGYRLRTTEPMMMHDLQTIPAFDSPATIERVTTRAMADRLAKIVRSRQILPEHLGIADAPLRQYIAQIDDQIVGWVRSIKVNDSNWCSNMHVLPAFRRRGIARSLLSHMLKDDRAHGAKDAVLTASHTGAKFYPLVGYRQIATLYLYAPVKRT